MRPPTPTATARSLDAGFELIRHEEGVGEPFPEEALDELEAVVARARPAGPNLGSVPFVTLDPPDSMDLDQAFHLERSDGGYRIRYAIADVAAWVAPAGALDREAGRRIETIYCPDRRVPLHPPALSEAAASLLPDGARPAVVWTIEIDRAGQTTGVDIQRATVSSRAKLGYPDAQAAIDDGSADGPLALLREVGEVLVAAERERGGMTLRVPAQEVAHEGDRLVLRFRRSLPVEDWNAQLSLLTGRAAAQLMLGAGRGILRTMPAADPRDVTRLRLVAKGLGIDWPADVPYGPFVTSLADELMLVRPGSPHVIAFLKEAASLFRGAGYAAFDGEPPALTTHAAIAAPYAHCTAPLRRLVDRYAQEACLSASAGSSIPEWVSAGLPLLPAVMADGGRRAARVERACIDLVEVALLAPFVGERFPATVVALDDDGDRGEIVLPDLAVLARCPGRLPLGERIEVTLLEADATTRHLRFAPVDPALGGLS